MTKRFGFTLAEVLITLGIIGVVAAMTIPTLIANTNSAKFRSQYKKSLSTLNQAALMGQAQYDVSYGDLSLKCKNPVASDDTAADTADADATICALFNDVLSGASYKADVSELTNKKGDYKILTATNGLDTDKFGGGTDAAAAPKGQAYELADGSLFVFEKPAVDGADVTCTKSSPCYGFIDVNGTTLPNKEVSCDNGKANSVAASGSGETATEAQPCVVANDAAHMTDIYPVKFYDTTVEPATDAARYVLTTSK